MQLWLIAYVSFVALLSLGLLALNLRPRKVESHKAKSSFKPKTLVIVPCKGMDLTLKENLSSMKSQSYSNYDLMAVADSNDDPALNVIKRLKIPYILATGPLNGASGKVRAICAAISKMRGYSIYVIADSDVLPEREWLSKMVAPFTDRRVGMSTAFPIFKPTNGFWPRVKYAWGFVGQGLMESELTRFGWGGSMAFRSDLIDSKNLRTLRKAVSDDIALTKMVLAKGFKIAYAVDAHVVVNTNDDLKQLLEWSTRQTALSIAGYGRNYRIALVFYPANILVLLSGIALAILVNPLLALLLAPFAVGAVRTYRRDRDRHPSVLAIYPIMCFFYLGNILAASRMNRITWRGATYSISGLRKPG
ncbi:MAG: glycosyltransferase family 2 protein [Candidatus Micrarchaeota archaeon]|nr:glycosyltransferase family 2 protein [Candidatus Micrarchaeota archaeon]